MFKRPAKIYICASVICLFLMGANAFPGLKEPPVVAGVLGRAYDDSGNYKPGVTPGASWNEPKPKGPGTVEVQQVQNPVQPDNYFVPTDTATRPKQPVQPVIQKPVVPAVTAPASNYFAPTATATQPRVQPVVTPTPPPPSPPVVPARKPGVKGGDVSFNFDDADVFSVIQTIFGDVLKVNYIVDPNVKGRVNFRSVAPVAKDDVLPLMEVILRLNGIGIVEEGGLFRIIPIADLSKEPTPVMIGRDADKIRITGKALVQVVPVLYSQSADLTRILTPFLSKSAVIIDVPKSNYIIIVDTDANIKRLVQLVGIFDNEQLKQITPKVFVYPIQNSKAKDVSALLQQIFLGSRPAAKPAVAARPGTPGVPAQPGGQPSTQPQVISGGQSTGEILVAEGTKIIPDEITNSIVVLATPEDYLVIYDTIQKIDIVPRQVMIEALIAEVTLSDNLNFGMQWSISNDLTIEADPFKKKINLQGGVFNFQAPISSPNFTYTALDAAGKIKLQIQSLAAQDKAKILSSPHILVSDNREARIQVGDQVPIATSTTTTTVTAGVTPSITSTIQYKDTGTILKVKPQVNDSGLVALEISQEVSDFKTTSLFGSDQIVISKREATSNLVAQDGQTIVIGGLIKDKITKGRSGLPFLSKLPVLGYLFGSTTDLDERTELIILLTPHVIRHQIDAKDVTSGYLKRLQGLKDIDVKRSEVIIEKSNGK